jgi:hypothetical protein
MATTASQFSSTFDVHDTFLLGKMYINHEKKNKVKISNLKMAKDSSVILKKSLKQKLGPF